MRFLLIHGGFKGAWCWSRLIPELEKLGHEAVAIDLPGHGERRDERSLLSDRRDAIVEALKPGDILLGHSGGGFDISLAADAAPELVGHLIYLSAGLPLEGRPLVDATGGSTSKQDNSDGEVTQLNRSVEPSYVRVNEMGRMEFIDIDAAREIWYHDCDEETIRWAFSQFSAAPPEILVEPVSIPRFWKADLPRSYILCIHDRSLLYAEQMAFAGRLGVVPLMIEGSHSPFFSRPAELAALMVQAVDTEPVAPLRPD